MVVRCPMSSPNRRGRGLWVRLRVGGGCHRIARGRGGWLHKGRGGCRRVIDVGHGVVE